MKNQYNIEVEHIARVEGHGNIRIGIEDGELTECSLGSGRDPPIL